jgi:hypothetical protein
MITGDGTNAPVLVAERRRGVQKCLILWRTKLQHSKMLISYHSVYNAHVQEPNAMNEDRHKERVIRSLVHKVVTITLPVSAKKLSTGWQ